ncbi:MAG: hypothetical protein JRG71_05565 [Deltaproteobacteria bacterium]|nr:hypothetical protein [Deltaproteobacteria bacterium]
MDETATSTKPSARLTDIENVLVCHQSKLQFLRDTMSSLVMAGGELNLSTEGVYGLDLMLGKMCDSVTAMRATVEASYSNNKNSR